VTAGDESSQAAGSQSASARAFTAGNFEAIRARVLEEVEDEVRQHRASGDLPPSFEQHLHETFERLTPTGAERGYFHEALKLADQTSYMDAEPPLGSNVPGGEIAKRAIHRLMSWYLGYVVQQVTQFTTAAARTLHLLDERVSKLERQAYAGHARLTGSAPDGSIVESEHWVELIGQRLAGLRGRVLHAECGDGALLRVLASAKVDVYGVDPRADLLDVAAGAGVDVRLESGLEHLRMVPESSLEGLVLSGFIDHLTLGDQRELVNVSTRALCIGGVMVLVGANPDAWSQVASPVAIDLSPGRPLHAETWALLFEQQGVSSVEVHRGSRGEGLQPVAGEGPAWEAMGSNLARLGEMLLPPASFLVVGVRRR
jgi:hypothetical protein